MKEVHCSRKMNSHSPLSHANVHKPLEHHDVCKDKLITHLKRNSEQIYCNCQTLKKKI